MQIDLSGFEDKIDGLVDEADFTVSEDNKVTAKPKYMRHFGTEEDRQENITSYAKEIYDEGRTVTEDGLKTDKNWIEASRTLHKMVNGFDLDADDDTVAKYGIDELSKFNYKLLGSGSAASISMDLSSATDEEKMAMFYMMETYDEKDATWSGVGRALEGIAEDPSSYMFGLGIWGKPAGQVGKESIKAMLKEQVAKIVQSKTAAGMGSGALYNLADDAARQNVKIEAKAQEEYSTLEGMIAATTGAAAGGVLANAPEIGRELVGGAKKAIGDFIETPMGDLVTGTMRMQEGGVVPNARIKAGDLSGLYNGDTQKVARERFDIQNLEHISRGGSDREVFDLGEGKALKVSKTARGIGQNEAEQDYMLAGTILPDVYESGKNYNVVEKVDFKAKRKEINQLTKLLASKDVYYNNRLDGGKLYNALLEAEEQFNIEGLTDLANFDLLWGDITASRNWGVGQDGRIVHADGGSISADILDVTDMDKSLWEEIKREVKRLKKEHGDVDKYLASLAGVATISSLKEDKK